MRRRLMYLVVGLQIAFLGAIVAAQELNMALDRSPAVDLDIVDARARKDAFRGASVVGASALDLDGRAAEMPAQRLRPGDRVLVVFGVEASGRPRIVRVERGGGAGGPSFAATRFSIPGTVRDGGRTERFVARESAPVARVGEPSVLVELDLPASIPVDAAALDRLSGPGLVRASLHHGFLGRRYFTDVRLIGRGWPAEVSFVYDEARQRLVVFAPREQEGRASASFDRKAWTDVFVFDALGKEVGSGQAPGRLLEGVVDPADGRLLALATDAGWGMGEVSLVRIGDDGQIVQRGAAIAGDRVVGFDRASGAAWVLTGSPSARPQPPQFIERMTLGGFQGPRLGPFASAPRAVLSVDDDVWVVETEQHRVTRFDRTSGRTLAEYRDVNAPTDIAVDGDSLYVIEANRTQLTKLSADGRVAWRIPRFQGLAWIVPEPGTGGGWVAATTLDGRTAGLVRVAPDGSIARLAASVDVDVRADWRRRRLAVDALRTTRDDRLYVLAGRAIVILGPDGALIKRLDGFRFTQQQRLRG